MTENNPNNTFIRLPELTRLTGLSRSSVYLKINPKSKYFDELFPKPVPLSSETRGAVAWLLAETNQWIESRIQARAEKEVTVKSICQRKS
ncbi:phage transcriptional regulator, AlpA [Nitrosomonas sp. Is79A3]|uniref:AlpA family phage regulatory protein n=1 Tax=Nitrosomonas sp. (strain Is79A3) TaxID=261292 RepID=UPI000215D287